MPVVAVPAGNQTVSVQLDRNSAGVQPIFRNSHGFGVMHMYKPRFEFHHEMKQATLIRICTTRYLVRVTHERFSETVVDCEG